jgi:hypothetical protein
MGGIVISLQNPKALQIFIHNKPKLKDVAGIEAQIKYQI